MTRCSHQQSPYQLLFGEPHIFEDLLGLKVRISPDAFFQINTAGAEMLYQTVRELSGVDSNTILLDICCGTGKWQPKEESACCLVLKCHLPRTQGP
jgi:tRNA (uracil-5-)-methyltransferase